MEQDPDDFRDPDDCTGILGDDLAREHIECLTEVGPDAGNRGVHAVAPGLDNTRPIDRKHHPKKKRSRADEIGSLDEPRDEPILDRSLGEDTAA